MLFLILLVYLMYLVSLFITTVVDVSDDNLSEFVILYREHCEVSMCSSCH